MAIGKLEILYQNQNANDKRTGHNWLLTVDMCKTATATYAAPIMYVITVNLYIYIWYWISLFFIVIAE